MNLTLTCRLGLRTSSALSFSPASLFTAGESGYWLDPSDFTTMWQDNQGVTPVTATGQTCGLILDKRIGTRTQVFDDANVTFGGLAGYAGRISPGVYEYARDASGNGSVFFGGLTAGRTYLISVQIAAYGGAIPGITFTTADFRNVANVVFRPAAGATGTYTAFYVADGTNFRIVATANGSGGTISNVSILEVAGNHFLQATAGNRPILGVEPFGGRRNLSVNTEQFNNASWIKTGVTITPDATVAPDGTATADRLTCTGGAAVFRSVQETVASAGVGRVFSVYVKADTQNFVQLVFNGTAASWANFDLASGVIGSGGTDGTPTITNVGNGWFRCSISTTVTTVQGGRIVPVTSATSVRAEANTLTTSLFIWGAQLENGSVVTAYQRVTDQWNVTQAGVPDCYYLAFDGTDDGMQSAATIDPGAVDKAQVFAGARKLVSTVGVVLESSVNAAANVGTFYSVAGTDTGALGAGIDGYTGFGRGSTGGASATAQIAQAAPDTAVIAMTHDIPADLSTIRRNTVVGTNATGDKGTGNFGTFTHYIGRRAGTSLPFNGRVYQMVMRFGPNLTAGQITQTETFVNSKTGAY